MKSICFEKELNIYKEPISLLKNSNKMTLGFITQFNNFQFFDGTILHLTGRFLPFPESINFKESEMGFMVSAYYNKDNYFFWFGDYATDGYELSPLYIHKFYNHDIKAEIGIAPSVFISNGNIIDFGNILSLFFRYKSFELWSSIYYNTSKLEFYSRECISLGGKCSEEFILEKNRSFFFRRTNTGNIKTNFLSNLYINSHFNIQPIIGISLIEDREITLGVMFKFHSLYIYPQLNIFHEYLINKSPVFFNQFGILSGYNLSEKSKIFASLSNVRYIYPRYMYELYQINFGVQILIDKTE